MNFKRNQGLAYDIAQIIEALNTVYETCCDKYSENCYECPLGSLGVLQTETCDEVGKLKSHLELVYRVVETL